MLDRRVLVTGGGSGIGLAGAQALRDQGARVVIADQSFDLVPEGFDAARIAVDVSEEASVEHMFDDAAEVLGGVDVVIHSAGIMREQGRDIREISLQSWNAVIAVNLTGAFLVARGAANVMRSQGGGVLILIGSPAGTYGPSGSVPYGASKGGVNGLVLTLADHLADTGIRVHNFCPGSVDTPLVQESLDEAISNGASSVMIERARSRLAGVDGIGRVLAFLASQDGASVAGNVRTI